MAISTSLLKFIRSLYLGTLLPWCLLLAILYLTFSAAVIPPEIRSVAGGHDLQTPHTVLHTFSNGYAATHESLLLGNLMSFLAPSLKALALVKTVALAGVLGFITLHLLGSAAIGVLVTALIVILLGSAPLLIGYLLWTAVLALVLAWQTKQQRMRHLLALLCSIEIAATAPQLGILLVGLSFATAALAIQTPRRHSPLIYLCCLAPVLYSLATSAAPPVSIYQHDGMLVPPSGLLRRVFPFVGTTALLPNVHDALLREQLNLFGWFALGSSLLTYVVATTRLRVLSLLIGIALWLDLSLGICTHQNAPLASLARLIPSAQMHGLTILALAFWLLLTVISWRRAGLVLGVLAVIVANRGAVTVPVFALHNPDKVTAFTRHAGDKQIKNILATPSFYALYHYSFSIPAQRGINFQLEPISGIPHQLFASSSQADLGLVTDQNPHTRWSPRTGSQRGDDWVLVRLTTPRKVWGVHLPTGDSIGDFPRGVRVSVSEQCSSREDGVFRIVYEESHWIGALEVQHPKGTQPYLRARPEVDLVFSRSHLAGCLLIEAIGYAPENDWSIAELGLLLAK